MKKTLVTTALACAMTVFGLATSLQAEDEYGLVESGTVRYSTPSLIILDTTKDVGVSLTANLTEASTLNGKEFGYCVDDQFVSLKDAIENTQTVSLPYNQKLKFGYGTSATDFAPKKVSFNVSSDPGYYAGYLNDGFYQLDFSSKPFDGVIDIVVGEPLPAPAVTLVVALAAGALFLLYKNRRQRLIQTEQA